MAVVVPIAADYDASGVQAAQASIAKFGQSITKSLQEAGKASKAALKQLEEGATDSRTAAQRLADSIGNVADRVESDLKASVKAADALSAALGPEMAARLGRNGLQKLVTDLNRAGLTMQDIEGEAETLAASIRRLDDINLSAVTGQAEKLDSAIAGVGHQADKSRSVFANFTGNAIQELPGVGAAIGPLNMALGQFTEYATEGEVSLKGLALTIGPIAALSAGLMILKSAMKANAEEAQLAKERTDSFTSSIRQGLDPVAAFIDEIRQSGELKGFDPAKGLFGAIKNVIPDLVSAGVHAADLRKALSDPNAAKALIAQLEQVRKAAKVIASIPVQLGGDPKQAAEAQAQYERLTVAIKLLKDSTSGLASAYKTSALEAEFFGEATTNVATSSQGANSQMAYMASNLDILAIKTGTAAEKQRRLAAEAQLAATNIDEARLAFYRSTNATFAYEDALGRAKTAVEKAAAAEKKARETNDPKDIAEATRLREEAKRAAVEASSAEVALADATSKTADPLRRQAELAIAGADAFTDLAYGLDPNSLLRQNLESYYQQLLNTAGDYHVNVIQTITGADGRPINVAAAQNLQMWRDWKPNPAIMAAAATANATRSMGVTNITINGAIDPVSTANNVQTILDRQNQRLGVSP